METWKMYDQKPDAPIESYPLYERYLYVTKSKEKARRGTLTRLKLYKDIRDNGYKPWRGPPLRIHFHRDGRIWCNGGHHRISILKHLNPDTVVEVVDTHYG